MRGETGKTASTEAPFGIAPALWEVLACPCPAHGSLIAVSGGTDPAGDRLVCTVCGLRFPIRDGIPVMLIDSADPVG